MKGQTHEPDVASRRSDRRLRALADRRWRSACAVGWRCDRYRLLHVSATNAGWAGDVPDEFTHLGDGAYAFCGETFEVRAESGPSLTAVEMLGFSFALEGVAFPAGQRIRGQGVLRADFFWASRRTGKVKAIPDLGYRMKVNRIWAVTIPDGFVSRTATGLGSPTAVPPSEYTDADKREVQTMRQTTPRELSDYKPGFFVVEYQPVEGPGGQPAT